MQSGRKLLALHVQASCVGQGKARRVFVERVFLADARFVDRAMSSALMSPVTYTPSKQEASKPSRLGLSDRSRASSLHVLVDQRVAADHSRTSSIVRP
jgi:hypothetical protein